MSTERTKYLLERFLEGNITVEEREELTVIVEQREGEKNVSMVLEGLIEGSKEPVWDGTRLDEMVRAVLNTDRGGIVKKMFPWRKIAVAASIALIVGLGSYLLFFNKPGKKSEIVETLPAKDVEAPKETKAMITLANGQKLYLDSVDNGTLAEQGNVKLVKLSNGQIAYQTSSGDIVKEIQYNTLLNPRGSKVIDMTLADGSRVWLNAGSSVTYPVAFIGNERKVSITGEAYFEISHDASKPFKVNKGEMEVTVLGTHFNVNAYDDESDIRVTLLEGSVKVNNTTIKPLQQAIIAGDIKVTNDVDVEQVMAWKNGIFKFKNTNISEIMRQVERWYNVDVEFKGDFADLNFGGSVSRQANVSELLKRLEATEEVTFKIEGRKIIVLKK